MPVFRLSWTDPRVRNMVWQVLILGTIAVLFWTLIGNVRSNLDRRHIATGFGFLSQAAHFQIGETLLSYDSITSTFARALLIGIVNTLKVAVVGIVLATILGTLIGIFQLSRNALLAKICAVYVEVMRDIPVLLHLLIWKALISGLPGVRQSVQVGSAYLSNRGIAFPVMAASPAWFVAIVGFAIGAAGTWLWTRAMRSRRERTGAAFPVWPVALLLMIGLPLLAWAASGAPVVIDRPEMKGFNFQGGWLLSPGYVAVTLGLVLYTAAYIAEVVRSGLLAVSGGQSEAAAALGLSRGQTIRLIVLPQALRVIIPPMTSEYLNLTKNSSLAAAVGYPDIVSIAGSINTISGQAIETITIIMAVYLTISLSISALMSVYERRIRLVER